LRRGEVRVVPLAIVAVVALAAVALAVVSVAPDLDAPPQFFSDFDINVWEPGRAILDGRSPLRASDAGPENGSVYPPAAQVATLPFTLMPYDLGLVLWLATLAAALVLALRVCGVVDWRVTVVALCSPPVLYGLAYANVSLLVTLALALVWSWRDRRRRVAIVVGVVVATRLFLWPLLVWLLITGRRRAAFESLLASLVVTAIGWAVVAFRRIGDFIELVRENASEYADDGVSVAAVAANLGLSVETASLIAIGAGVAALALAWRTREDDLESFAWAIVAALLASPVVWSHYYALLLVPLALSTPRLSRWWLLPYVTLPQLSIAAEAGGRVVDAGAGLLFAGTTAVHCRPSLRAAPEPELVGDPRPAEI
jgi:hypothetical protein